MKQLMCLYPIVLLFLSGCASQKNEHKESNEIVVDLNASTEIIINAISKNSLATFLELCEPEDVNRLIKNFSPALLALDAEVLNWAQPVILLFIDKKDPEYQVVRTCFDTLAHEYKDAIKFVEIDAIELFKIAEHCEVEKLPALSLMHNREELRFVDNLTLVNFQNNLQLLIGDAAKL